MHTRILYSQVLKDFRVGEKENIVHQDSKFLTVYNLLKYFKFSLSGLQLIAQKSCYYLTENIQGEKK